MARQEKPLSRKGEKAVSLAEDMKDVADNIDNIVSSYETKIRSVGAIFNTTHQLLHTFQDSFLDAKLEREKLKAELRENLARNGSLRKRDFDNMMQEILSNQERSESQVRELLNSYLNGQQEMTHALRDNLAKVKDALAKGQAQRAREFQAVIKDILAKQEKRKQEATFKLKEFQKEQQEIAKRLGELLAKGRELRVADLKSMLAEFKRQHKQRPAQQKTRRGELHGMLGNSHNDRVEAAEDWQRLQKKTTRTRAVSTTEVNVGT